MRKEWMLSWESLGQNQFLMHHYFSMITESKLPWHQQNLCNQLILHSASLQLTNHFAPDFYVNKLFWRTIQNQRKGVVYRLKHAAMYMTNDMTDDKNTKINSRSHKVMKWPTLTLAPSLLSRWQSVLPAVRVERGGRGAGGPSSRRAYLRMELDLRPTLTADPCCR